MVVRTVIALLSPFVIFIVGLNGDDVSTLSSITEENGFDEALMIDKRSDKNCFVYNPQQSGQSKRYFYVVNSVKKNFSDAIAYCRNISMRLAKISDRVEEAFLTSKLHQGRFPDKPYFIGYIRSAAGQPYRHIVTGEELYKQKFNRDDLLWVCLWKYGLEVSFGKFPFYFICDSDNQTAVCKDPPPSPRPPSVQIWGEWTACTKSCGGGIKERNGTCDGSECSDRTGCNYEDCPENTTTEPPEPELTDFFFRWSIAMIFLKYIILMSIYIIKFIQYKYEEEEDDYNPFNYLYGYNTR